MSDTSTILKPVTTCALLLLVFALCLLGGGPLTPGLIRGDLIATEGTALAGTLSVRDDENRVTRCAYDAKTYVEIEKNLATAGQLRVGDRLEVLTDREPGSAACYIRSIHSTISPAVPRPRRPRLDTSGQPLSAGSLYVIENIYPRGNLTFSGVVVQLNPERLVLHTRSAEETIFLRSDTRYVASGLPVQPGDLRVNRRVFIRAGRNLDNEIEAFQVVWGDILQPK